MKCRKVQQPNDGAGPVNIGNSPAQNTTTTTTQQHNNHNNTTTTTTTPPTPTTTTTTTTTTTPPPPPPPPPPRDDPSIRLLHIQCYLTCLPTCMRNTTCHYLRTKGFQPTALGSSGNEQTCWPVSTGPQHHCPRDKCTGADLFCSGGNEMKGTAPHNRWQRHGQCAQGKRGGNAEAGCCVRVE